MSGNPYAGQTACEKIHQLYQVPDVLSLKILKSFPLQSSMSIFRGLTSGWLATLAVHSCKSPLCGQWNQPQSNPSLNLQIRRLDQGTSEGLSAPPSGMTSNHQSRSGSSELLSLHVFPPVPLSYSCEGRCEVNFLNPLNGPILAAPVLPKPSLESQRKRSHCSPRRCGVDSGSPLCFFFWTRAPAPHAVKYPPRSSDSCCHSPRPPSTYFSPSDT